MTRHRLWALYSLTAVMLVGLFIALEFGVRHYRSVAEPALPTLQALMARLPDLPISGREIGNQMLVHNVALFARHPAPERVNTAYVGTSRTKLLRPEQFGVPAAVVGAGNSYNEISYGLLLQAEILRLRFPYLKRVYFEASMLLRRPARLIIEEDHQKYRPLLESLAPLCAELPRDNRCKQVFDNLSSMHERSRKRWHSELLKQRATLRISNLIPGQSKDINVVDDPLLAGLSSSGERKFLSRPAIPSKDQVLEISNENVKVQRLREIVSAAPWDGLFDLIAMWGHRHNIEVIFFQPPVRSDLYRFQAQYGLTHHVTDIERVARQYEVPFIDLNVPELGYMNDWSMFSDEDHMETCVGSGLLTLALEEGYTRYRMEKEIFPKVERRELQANQLKKLEICS